MRLCWKNKWHQTRQGKQFVSWNIQESSQKCPNYTTDPSGLTSLPAQNLHQSIIKIHGTRITSPYWRYDYRCFHVPKPPSSTFKRLTMTDCYWRLANALCFLSHVKWKAWNGKTLFCRTMRRCTWSFSTDCLPMDTSPCDTHISHLNVHISIHGVWVTIQKTATAWSRKNANIHALGHWPNFLSYR